MCTCKRRAGVGPSYYCASDCWGAWTDRGGEVEGMDWDMAGRWGEVVKGEAAVIDARAYEG